MKLTLKNRLKLCFEILTVRSGHSHKAQEKQLSTFMRGYEAGRTDEKLIRLSDLRVRERNLMIIELKNRTIKILGHDYRLEMSSKPLL